MNPLDARETEETYEYPARPYTLPMRPVQTFKVLSESGDRPVTANEPSPWDIDCLDCHGTGMETLNPDEEQGEHLCWRFATPSNRGCKCGCMGQDTPSVGETAWEPYKTPANAPAAQATEIVDQLLGELALDVDRAWSDKHLTAEDARVLRQDGI